MSLSQISQCIATSNKLLKLPFSCLKRPLWTELLKSREIMEALVRSTMNGKKKKPEVVTQLLPDGTKEEKIIQPKAWWLSKNPTFFFNFPFFDNRPRYLYITTIFSSPSVNRSVSNHGFSYSTAIHYCCRP